MSHLCDTAWRCPAIKLPTSSPTVFGLSHFPQQHLRGAAGPSRGQARFVYFSFPRLHPVRMLPGGIRERGDTGRGAGQARGDALGTPR